MNPVEPTVRRATAADAATVRDMTRAAYAKWVPVIGREPLPMRADYDKAVRKHTIDLLYVDGEHVGLIEIIRRSRHLLIENVVVAPAFQGRGHGRWLLEHAERLAASLGLSEMKLYTNKAFAANVELYRRFGYRVDREKAFMGGTTVYMSKRLISDAERVVQGQLDAYNARDIDAFMQWWADDCRYCEFPDRLLAAGAAEIRERHVVRFREPNLHGKLIDRMAVANVVVDREVVTRTFDDGPGEVDVVAMYEVKDGKIATACFKMGPPRLGRRRT